MAAFRGMCKPGPPAKVRAAVKWGNRRFGLGALSSALYTTLRKTVISLVKMQRQTCDECYEIVV